MGQKRSLTGRQIAPPSHGLCLNSPRRLHTSWLLYGLALLPLCMLEGAVFGRLSFWPYWPALLPLAVSIVGTLEGSAAGAGYGLYAGFFASLLHPSSYGLWLFGLALLGFLAGALFHAGGQAGFLRCLAAAFVFLALLELLHVLYFLIRGGGTLSALLSIAGPTLFCSLLAFPLVYGLYRPIYRQAKGRTPI